MGLAVRVAQLLLEWWDADDPPARPTPRNDVLAACLPALDIGEPRYRITAHGNPKRALQTLRRSQRTYIALQRADVSEVVSR
jgi:hypothetical protein